MSRKYRQRGYMEFNTGPDKSKRSDKKRNSRDFEGPRGRSASPMFKTFHCERCGETFPDINQVDFDQKCPNCQSDLHACNQCAYFDPGSRHECMKPIPEPISRKDTGNQCTFFSAKFTWKHASTPKNMSVDEARKVLDNLFKK